MQQEAVHVTYPAWVEQAVDWEHRYITDTDKMALAIRLSQWNIEHGTGEPFGAAIFGCDTGQLVAVGLSQVVRQADECLRFLVKHG